MVEVVAAGGLTALDLQPCLSATTTSDLALLDDALGVVSLPPHPDDRWLKGARSTTVKAGNCYNALRVPVGGPPLTEVNWDCFVPKKVKVFFRVLRHHCTRTQELLHWRGILDAPDYPFCPRVPVDEDHLFATCPRLALLWALLRPGQAASDTVLQAATGICGSLPSIATSAAHTVALAVL